MIYIGFDFSIKKPACTVIEDGDIFYYCWPVDVNDKTISILKSAEICATPYKSKKTSKEYSATMRDTVINAMGIANLICETLEPHLSSDKKVVIAQEGFSFNSKGSSILDLAGYKYILMQYLNKYVPFDNMYTYAPISVKKTAGCAKKGMGKMDMIEAFKVNSTPSKIKMLLNESPQSLMKKTNFVECVDDIVDSYWVTMTMIEDLK